MATKDQKDDQYKQYLKEKHAGFGTDPEVVKGIVAKATGVETDSITINRVVAGEVNEVYDAQARDGNYIVRISRREDTEFLAEKWALDKSREAGVPAPNIFFVDKIKDKGKKLKICVENKLPGTPMNELIETGELTDGQIRELNVEAGMFLAKIHSVVPRGFGRIHEGGVGRSESWGMSITRPWYRDQIGKLHQYAERIGITKGQVDRAIAILNEHGDIYEPVTPHLLHCDYGPKHHLVSNGRITGIIDFENCMSGDPVYDFAWNDYFGHDSLKEGYLRVTDLPDDFDLRLKLYGLRIGLDLIWWYVEENHPTGMIHAKKKMDELLKYFDSRS